MVRFTNGSFRFGFGFFLLLSFTNFVRWKLIRNWTFNWKSHKMPFRFSLSLQFLYNQYISAQSLDFTEMGKKQHYYRSCSLFWQHIQRYHSRIISLVCLCQSSGSLIGCSRVHFHFWLSLTSTLCVYVSHSNQLSNSLIIEFHQLDFDSFICTLYTIARTHCAQFGVLNEEERRKKLKLQQPFNLGQKSILELAMRLGHFC